MEQQNTLINHEDFFNDLRKKEFSRLDETNQVYLDYTGGNLYPKSLLEKHFNYLQKNVLGNPHSTNPTSLLSTQFVQEAREKVISFFNAKDYYCIFTSNASGALHIVGECYPFKKNSLFLLTADNHNSVNGIREYCKAKGGEFKYCQINYEDLTLNDQQIENYLNSADGFDNKLFAYPAQSNVSGIKHNLNWIEKAKQKGWDVLLDAAAFVPTTPLDLSKITPDFISISFYKIFGYPTGIGCLLVHKDKFDKLQKPWFAGGTVKFVSINYPGYFLATDHERFENGTVNYLDIPAITNGLNFIEEIGFDRITNRIKFLMAHLIDDLHKIKHSNQHNVVRIFGSEDLTRKGGTLIFNLLDDDGKLFSIEDVEQMANENKISLRTGCFCNPGIDEINNCVSTDELMKYFTTKHNGSYHDMLYYLGRMRGAIRISVGIATTMNDLNKFIDFIKTFVDKKSNLAV
ncbi:MAG: aminotransferase class V-fold PLP-dependent enzyme [Chitinophagales bacterium]|nr:aminotransferase class V-fold PLP-dependent enzyme [Chitinophagales bacterium]